MPEEENLDIFQSYLDKVDDNDPLNLAEISVTEKVNLLETEEERKEARAAMAVAVAMRAAQAALASGVSNVDMADNAQSFVDKAEDVAFAKQQANKILEFLNDQAKISEFYKKHKISKNKMDFGMKRIDSPSGSTKIYQSPDREGFQHVINSVEAASTAEIDNRLQTPYPEDSIKVDNYEMYKEKTHHDITGRAYLEKELVPHMKELYMDSLTKGMMPEFGETPQELDDELDAAIATKNKEEVARKAIELISASHLDVDQYIAGMAYESSLLATHLYNEALEDYLKNH